MRKIMFNDYYGLTDAVLQGRKTMTRRAVGNRMTDDDIKAYLKGYTELADKAAPYKIGEVVAVAQAYKDIEEYNPESYEDVMLDQGTICEASHPYSHLMKSGGWDNKMFVRADLMPHQIRITDIKVERLQDISDEDCLKEGVYFDERYWVQGYKVENLWNKMDRQSHFRSAKAAFAALIERPGIGHKGDWSKNPWVFVYSFELIKL